MSRFDLLYILLDKPDEKDDRKLGQHLVTLYLSNRPVASSENFIPAERFTKYINYAKTITPAISEEAGEALVASYISMRKIGSVGGGNTISFTTRQLESMIRLSEAHAKMRYSIILTRLSRVVEKQDVDEAHRLLLAALQTSAIDPRTGRIDLDLVYL